MRRQVALFILPAMALSYMACHRTLSPSNTDFKSKSDGRDPADLVTRTGWLEVWSATAVEYDDKGNIKKVKDPTQTMCLRTQDGHVLRLSYTRDCTFDFPPQDSKLTGFEFHVGPECQYEAVGYLERKPSDSPSFPSEMLTVVRLKRTR